MSELLSLEGFGIDGIHDALDDALDLATDVLEFVEDTILGALGHVFDAVGFETANLGFLGSGVVELVLVDLLTDLDEFLACPLPVVCIVVAAIVAQFIGEVLQLIDGTLFGGACGHDQYEGSAKNKIPDFHIPLVLILVQR